MLRKKPQISGLRSARARARPSKVGGNVLSFSVCRAALYDGEGGGGPFRGPPLIIFEESLGFGTHRLSDAPSNVLIYGFSRADVIGS